MLVAPLRCAFLSAEAAMSRPDFVKAVAASGLNWLQPAQAQLSAANSLGLRILSTLLDTVEKVIE
jgi:hypothetical protein